MDVKNLFMKLIVLLVLATAPFMMFNYIVDPYQYFRQPTIYEVGYFNNQRFQNPGLARNYTYDSVIIGTSMTENYDYAYVSQELEGEYIKLSISGSSAREQNLILNVAIENNKGLKEVIWGIDYGALQGDYDRVENEQFDFPYYLYDNNRMSDLRYLINKNTLLDSIKVLRQDETNRTRNLNDLNVWGNRFTYGKDEVLTSYKNLLEAPINWEEYSYEYLEKSFNENVLNVIKDNEDINFILYFPPYSIYHFKLFSEKGVLEEFLRFKTYMVEQCNVLGNVEVYDFQDIKEITTDLTHYKDTSHHSPEINKVIINDIKQKNNQLTVDNVKKRSIRLLNQVLNHTQDEY
ncbi:hypothetical protein EDC19_0041 [Natranaerovirga hydrolytica]|uniref:Uncharacterized protein n=1 Tax=Natranaerovirga hydrolytica TaxID=680378 RepID=A0A4R1N1Q7_9FIRM|nr:hypothetical protein [Natranaerovirga hydrolytica]TCL00060.1 hypothetical protein EDC19_0041 [Natranaerovirga hydrolytica]